MLRELSRALSVSCSGECSSSMGPKSLFVRWIRTEQRTVRGPPVPAKLEVLDALHPAASQRVGAECWRALSGFGLTTG